MANGEDLVDAWWGSSQTFRDDFFWTKAGTALATDDARVLVVGPGERHSQRRLTTAIEAFLNKAGFSAKTLDNAADLDSHRDLVRNFPMVAALPLSVGSAAEVADFLHHRLNDQLAVVVPKDDASTYLARLLDDAHVSKRLCDDIGPATKDVDPAIGRIFLEQLGAFLVRDDQRAAARAESEKKTQSGSTQGRLADQGSVVEDQPNVVDLILTHLGTVVTVLGALGALLAGVFDLGLVVVGGLLGLTLGTLVTMIFERLRRPRWRLIVVVVVCIVLGLGLGWFAEGRSGASRAAGTTYVVDGATPAEGISPRRRATTGSRVIGRPLKAGSEINVECSLDVGGIAWLQIASDGGFVQSRFFRVANGASLAPSC